MSIRVFECLGVLCGLVLHCEMVILCGHTSGYRMRNRNVGAVVAVVSYTAIHQLDIES